MLPKCPLGADDHVRRAGEGVAATASEEGHSTCWMGGAPCFRAVTGNARFAPTVVTAYDGVYHPGRCVSHPWSIPPW